MAAKRRAGFFLIILVLIIILAGGAFFAVQYFMTPPSISLAEPVKYVGAATPIKLAIEPQGMGVKELSISVIQGGQELPVLTRDVSVATGPKFQVDIIFDAKKLGLKQGQAELVARVRDTSPFNWLRGNLTQNSFPINVDTEPPALAALNPMIRMNRGGSGLVIYRLGADAVEHGVTVGDYRFPGVRPQGADPGIGLCYFAYSQALDKDAPIHAWAKDEAGNQRRVPLNVRLKWKNYRHAKLNLSQRAVDALAARFADKAPAQYKTPLEVFTWVNTKLRESDDQQSYAITERPSPAQLWQKAFLRPQGKPMAGFGDRRTYFFDNKEISKAVHLGVDLADVMQSPINAVADGKVAFAGAMGIYGNCVVLDHGQGIYSLYGHMTATQVAAGDSVARGQSLGPSGATGLALGDHLHFSVVINGVFVNPTEWWDPHWIKDNILIRFSEAGVAPAGASQEKEAPPEGAKAKEAG